MIIPQNYILSIGKNILYTLLLYTIPVVQQSFVNIRIICPAQNIINRYSETVSSKTSAKGNGCLWKLGRTLLIICTCGLWLLVGKHKGTGKTKVKSQIFGICQDCGHKFKV